MKIFLKGFCTGILFIALIQLILLTPSFNVMCIWVALSIGIIFGAVLVWASAAVD